MQIRNCMFCWLVHQLSFPFRLFKLKWVSQTNLICSPNSFRILVCWNGNDKIFSLENVHSKIEIKSKIFISSRQLYFQVIEEKQANPAGCGPMLYFLQKPKFHLHEASMHLCCMASFYICLEDEMEMSL